MSNLQGKVAVITGAGRAKGLGQGIALKLAQQGCRVVIADIGHSDQHMPESMVGTTDEMQAIAAAIESETGNRAIAVACDVRDEDQVKQLFDRTVEAFGRLDILVNNAGIGYLMKPLVEVTRSEWQAVLDVNLMGAFLATKHAGSAMIEQGTGGRIVNIASQGGKTGFPHLAAFQRRFESQTGIAFQVGIKQGQGRSRSQGVSER